MNDKYKILALIPARGGSKGIKDKNIIDVNGKPLIAYTIIEAMKLGKNVEIVVTTDSEKIAECAKAFGAEVPFIRPSDLATDVATMEDVALHAVNELKQLGRTYDILLLLQPTSPLRKCDHIQESLNIFINGRLQSLVSICEVRESPVFMRTFDENRKLLKLLKTSSRVRRQDLPKYYTINGAIYINWVKDLCKTTQFNENKFGYVMDRLSSVNVDEPDDLDFLRFRLVRGTGK